MTVHCFTSATFAYLDRARVLAASIRQHHPDWRMSLCLPDTPPKGISFKPADEPFDDIYGIDVLDLPQEPGWLFEHDVVELCTAVKGAAMVHELEAGAEKVVYLDPDIAVFSPLEEVLDLLDQQDIVLTPHLVTPAQDRYEIIENEISSLKHGIYNLGFAAVANRGEGREFAHWWSARLQEFCFDELDAGLFTDQRWCDLAPAFFEKLAVLRHPGFNVASWNLAQRPMSVNDDGELFAAGAPLRFFHFTKVNNVGEQMIERYSGNTTLPVELLRWYRRELATRAIPGVPQGYWKYATFSDGSEITRAHRRAYRDHPTLRTSAVDPFAASASTFEDLLASP